MNASGQSSARTAGRRAAGIALLLAACAAEPLEVGLKGLIGHNIKDAVAAMGDPDGKRTMMGETIFVWFTSQRVLMPGNSSTTTSSMGAGPSHAMEGNLVCTVQITTDANGTIKSYKWNGNQGCRRYAKGFR